MGEVFRAHDPRLKRDVALKVLPAAAVGDAEKRRRFEREAQVLRTLVRWSALADDAAWCRRVVVGAHQHRPEFPDGAPATRQMSHNGAFA
jgi:serine/threonine protein kinase